MNFNELYSVNEFYIAYCTTKFKFLVKNVTVPHYFDSNLLCLCFTVAYFCEINDTVTYMARRRGIGYDTCCQAGVTRVDCTRDVEPHHCCAASVPLQPHHFSITRFNGIDLYSAPL